MREGKVTDKIYHGCTIMYSNGERLLINFENGEKCLIPMLNSFWSKEGLNNCRLQTRNSAKQQKVIKGPIKFVKIN